jgi:hypothetical protein
MVTGNTYEKYSSYSVEELLQDDLFITSVAHPTEETEAFWEDILKKEVLRLQDYELACCFIRSVQVKPESVTTEEIFNIWESIEVANKNNLRIKKKHFRLYVSAAASIIAILMLLFAGNQLQKKQLKEAEILHIENIEAPDAPAANVQLILANKEALSLYGKNVEIVHNATEIVVNNYKTAENKQSNRDDNLMFNQLIVPVGKRSTITFDDGSKLWVNAGTRVIFPTIFNKEKREIYVDGEVFMEVFHDENHPFVVKTRQFNMEVLGTTFNVMAYEKDTFQSIVLVSGGIKVHSKNKKETILMPNERYSVAQNGSSWVKSVNVDDYISWKSGLYQYQSECLDVIVKRLSRYYGQEIDYSPQVAHLKCSGKLDLKDDLQLVLNGISQTAPIKYEYTNERYRITNK